MLQFPLFIRDHSEDLLQVFIFSLAASVTIKSNNNLTEKRRSLTPSLLQNEDEIKSKVKPFTLTDSIINKVKKQYSIYKKKQKQLQQERELLNDDFNEDGE